MRNNSNIWALVRLLLPILIISLFVSIYIVLTYAWLRANTVPPSWDQSAFLKLSELFYWAWEGKNFARFSDLYMNSFSGRNPPFIALIPFPVYQFFGNTTHALSIVFVSQIIIFTWFYYLLIRDLTRSPYVALVAVILTNTMPLVAYMSRTYLIEYPQMVLTVVFLYVLNQSSDLKIQRYNIILGVLLGLGLLLKITFPIYVAGPFLLVVLRRLRENRRQTIAEQDILYANYLAVLIPVLILMVTWYPHNLHRVFSYSVSSAFGILAKDYSTGYPLRPSVLLGFWSRTITDDISSYQFFLLLVPFLAIALKQAYRNWKDGGLGSTEPALPLLFLWFVVPFFVVSISENKNPKYVLPLLPAIGGLTAGLLARFLEPYKYRSFFTLILLVFPITSYVYGIFPQGAVPSLRIGHIHILNEELITAYQPITQDWPVEAIIDRIIQDASAINMDEQPENVRVTLVVDHPYFNQNTFGYFASRADSPIVFNALLTRTELDWIFQKDVLMTAHYIITKTGFQGPEFRNSSNASVSKLLTTHELPYEEIFVYPLPDDSMAIIYRQNDLNSANLPSNP